MPVELRYTGGGRGELRVKRLSDPVSEIGFHFFRDLMDRVVFAIGQFDAFFLRPAKLPVQSFMKDLGSVKLRIRIVTSFQKRFWFSVDRYSSVFHAENLVRSRDGVHSMRNEENDFPLAPLQKTFHDHGFIFCVELIRPLVQNDDRTVL